LKKQRKILASRNFLNLFNVVHANYFSEGLWETTKDMTDSELIPILIFPLGRRLMCMLPLHLIEMRKDRSLNTKMAYIVSWTELKKDRKNIIKNAKNILRRI
tara:strand:- start:893 stop:1198 length:306 start_codon:yes stop_codon:yes gene_type:complete